MATGQAAPRCPVDRRYRGALYSAKTVLRDAMFDLEQFVADCRAALAADRSHKLVREVIARAVSDPQAVLNVLGEPTRAQIQTLHHAPDLTILNVIWGPMMTIMPHNHRMWAVIGIYTGREDNVFWRRIADDPTAAWKRPAPRPCACGMPSRSATTSSIR